HRKLVRAAAGLVGAGHRRKPDHRAGRQPGMSYRRTIGPRDTTAIAALIDFTIDSLGAQGDGVAQDDRKPVFIAYALPGEKVRARLVPKGGNAFIGRLQDVVTSAPDRVVPPCPLFTKCGGCALQHLSLPAYRLWKREQVAVTLAQRGIELPAA